MQMSGCSCVPIKLYLQEQAVSKIWTSALPVAQMVKNLPVMQETQLQSMGQKDSLEKAMATHSNILAWSIPWTVHGVAKGWTQLSNFHSFIHSFPGCASGKEPACQCRRHKKRGFDP